MAAVRIGYAFFCIGLLIYGILDVLSNFEDNKCQMTYMFEMPEYLKVPMQDEVTKEFPRYELYAYGEGEYAEYVRKLKLEGIPVLFIPGNAGSHKQVRSLASVALRRVEDKKTKFHFNYFSVNLNEELSGLYGGVLEDQTKFVHKCIKKILTLYKDAPNPPKTVMLVGHSMGGLLARAVFLQQDFDASLVNTIITQATPHQGPVIPLDHKISGFINQVNRYWIQNGKTLLKHVTVVSTGGGFRDVHVKNSLTSLKGIVEESNGVYTSTMAVPNAWVSTDHQCAVWCKQVVMATKRAMFDIIDPKTLQVSTDVEMRMKVFKHYFLSHSGAVNVHKGFKQELQLDPSAKWIFKEKNLWEYAKAQAPGIRYIAVPLNKKNVDSFVAISNVGKDWICACKMEPGQKHCSKCKNLSHKGHIIPPVGSGRKVLHLALSELKEMTHIVLVVTATRLKVEVMADMYNQEQRHLAYKMPGFIDIMMTYPESVTKSASKLTLFNDTMYYNLKLQGMYTVLQAYSVTLKTKKCAASKSGLHAGSMMVLNVPWSHDDAYSFSSLSDIGNLSVKLQTGVSSDLDEDDLQLQVYIDPSCSYELNFVAAPSEMLGQLARFYYPMIPSFAVSVLLMGVVQQLFIIGRDEKCLSILDALAMNAQPFKLIPFVIIIRVILQLDIVRRYSTKFGLVDDDGWILSEQGLYFRFLPLMLYIITLGMVTFHCYVVDVAFTVMSKIFGVMFSWFPADVWSKIELVLVVLSGLVSLFLCSAVGIFICYVLCFIKVIILKYKCNSSKEAENRFHFFVSLLMLWMWMVVLNVPALITWFKNLRYSLFLLGDPNKIPVTVGVVSIGIMLVLDNPLPPRMSYKGVYFSVYAAAVILLLYGMISTYRVIYVIIYTVSATAAYQVLYKFRPPVESTANDITN